MPLDHEEPLRDYHAKPEIGGSAGKKTHGGTAVERPDGMPSKGDCDVVVQTADQFASAVQRDDTSVYIDETIKTADHVADNGGIDMGSNVTLVAGFCDPSIPGRGPEIVCEENGHRLLTSRYGTAPTLWGVSMRGPELEYHDPDHTADDFDSKQSTALFCYDDDKLRVIGSEFRGWTMAGLEIGAKSHETDAEIRRCSFHSNNMEHLGYGIEQYNGFMSVTDSFFDECRHAISSFGYPTGGYAVATSVFGPGPWSGHQIDMHGVANNISTDSNVAGDFVRMFRCTVMGTEDVEGYGQEGLAIRGVPKNKEPGSYVDKTHFYHSQEPSPTGEQGDAYRQETSEWANFEPRDNHFGTDPKDGYGAPRAQAQEKPAEDDEDRETEDPSGTPTTPDATMKLTIHGKGSSGSYEIWLNGTAEATGNIEDNDTIDDSNGLTKLTGGIVGAADTYELNDGATLERAWFRAPARVTLDGEPIDTGSLVAVEADRRFSEQSQRLDQLRDWARGVADSLRQIPGGSQ